MLPSGGAMEKNEIEILHFGSGKVERISFEDMGGHVGQRASACGRNRLLLAVVPGDFPNGIQ